MLTELCFYAPLLFFPFNLQSLCLMQTRKPKCVAVFQPGFRLSQSSLRATPPPPNRRPNSADFFGVSGFCRFVLLIRWVSGVLLIRSGAGRPTQEPVVVVHGAGVG